MRTTIDIPDELWEQGKALCAKHRCSFSELTRRALQNHVGSFIFADVVQRANDFRPIPAATVNGPDHSEDFEPVNVLMGESIVSMLESKEFEDKTTADMRKRVDSQLPKVLPRK